MDTSNRSTDEHLTPELIADYHLGQVSEQVEAEVKNHLIQCRDCAELLLDFQELMEVEGAEISGSGAASPEAFASVEEPAFGRSPDANRRAWGKLASMAALVVLFVGLASLIFKPSTTVPSVRLQESVRGSESISVVDMSHGALILLLPVTTAGPFEIRILSSRGVPIRTDYGVRAVESDPSHRDSSHIEVLIGDLDPDTYRVAILKDTSSGGLEAAVLTEYSFRIAE